MVVINPKEVNDVVHALRKAASDKNARRTTRWRCAMLANAIERRAV